MRGFEIHGSSLQLLRMVAGKSGHLGPLSHPTAIGLNSTLSCFHPWQSPNFLGFWSRTKFLLHSKIAYQSILMMNKAQDLNCGWVVASFSSTARFPSEPAESSIRNEDNTHPAAENSSVHTDNAQSERSTRTVPHSRTIRGSPVSWLSVGLLFTTGAGVIYYFDKEKQRRIEEKDSGIKITPVFISVDPERDNVEQIHEYVKEFHPRLVGLTGSVDDIKEVAREYRVYYMKTEEDESDYLVDHSIITYLMDPNMEFVKFFGKNYDVNSLSDEIVKEIRKVNASSTV
eukprot:c24390_g2_i3 orf=163-1020(+)